MDASSTQLSNRIRTVAVAFSLTVSAFLVGILCSMVALFPMFAMGYEFNSTPVTIVSAVTVPIGSLLVGYLFVRRYGVTINVSQLSRQSGLYIVTGVVGPCLDAQTFAV
jgi:hypothetical protein